MRRNRVVETFGLLVVGVNLSGLGSIITKLGALIIALSFALKEPVADFISYFIID